MGLNAKNKEYTGNTNRVEQEAMEAGTYPARLVQVIDLGVQEQQPFKGDPKPPAQEIMVTYEFPDEFIKDEEGNDIEDKPRWLSETFPLHPLDSDLAKSTKRYYAIDPECEEGGDWAALIGKPVMVTIVANPGKGKNAGKVFNNVTSTSSMRKKEADKLPELKNEGKVLDLSDADTADILLTLPQWIQDKIKGGLEYEGCAVEKALKKNGKKEDGEAANKKAKKAKKEDDEDVSFDTDEKQSGSDGDDENDW